MYSHLDIVIPFYNPVNGIIEELGKNLQQMLDDKIIQNFRVILVNDGSSKKEYETELQKVLETYKNYVTFLDLPKNQGKGGAIKEGVRNSTAENVIFYDIDFPFGMDALYRLYQKLLQPDSKIVIAKRDPSYFKKLPLKRKFISLTLKSIIFTLSGGKIKDSQAGLKGLKREVVPTLLDTQSNSFIMDFEFLLRAIRRNIAIDYVTVTPNDHIQFTDFSTGVLWNEVKTFLKIVISRF